MPPVNNPQNPMDTEQNTELEALAQLGMQGNEKLDSIEANTEASAIKADEIEKNTEATALAVSQVRDEIQKMNVFLETLLNKI